MILRTNPRIEKNFLTNGHIGIVPAIQNGYMAAPAVEIEVDYNVFRKTPEERAYLATMKAIYKSQNPNS